MNGSATFFEPGMRVEAPGQPDWGVGQVQSNVDGRVTVNFREAGKLVLDGAVVTLVPVMEP